MTRAKNAESAKKLRARPGMGLPMALVIILIGSGLVMFVINASGSFMVQTTYQQTNYLDHINVVNYVERVKGMISERNAQLGAAGTPVLHRDGYPDTPIENADDLLIKAAFGANDIYIDEDVDGSSPRQLVRVRVFDASYMTADLHGDYLVDGAIKPNLSPAQKNELAQMPPPLTLPNLKNVSTGDDDENDENDYISNLDDTREQNKDPSSVDGGGPGINLDDIGMYVIRVELVDAETNRLIRFAEEAFFQVASPDV